MVVKTNIKNYELRITESQYSQLVQIAKKAYPNESAGLIFGNVSHENEENKDETFYIYVCKKIEEFESSKPSPVYFLLNDVELVYRKWNQAQEEGYSLISIYHSHPNTAYPSGIDADYMQNIARVYPNIIWTIYGNGSKELNGFILDSDTKIKRVKIQIGSKT
ncbi:MAG: hypothetical protein GF364_18465 [Candidatus Lokiarchaeota archaeon]|nr:hypothetical protein [Candidatus Lokiarchaeota archaeon]